MLPRRLVLSGGGIKVVSLVGSLKVLHENGYLKHVKEVCGVSAGAFLAFMMTACSLETIQQLISDIDFSVIRNITAEAFFSFPETFGIDDGSKLVKFLESIMRVALKVDPAVTFGEFKGIYMFRCWATDLKTYMTREFSAAKTPSVKIIDALRASMSLPIYYTPVPDPITGHVLSDGGIQGNLPLHTLTDKECQETLSLGFSPGTVGTTNGPQANGPQANGPQDLMSYMNAILLCVLSTKNNALVKQWSHQIIRIPVDEYPSWNFEASREDRSALFESGVQATREWLSSRPHLPIRNLTGPLRRHSC